MKKLISIISGWWNYIFQKDEVEIIASQRAKICGRCPHLTRSFFDVIHDDNNPDISGMECNICGCPIATKIRSLFEECADETPRWGKIN